MACPYPSCPLRGLEDKIVIRDYCIERHSQLQEMQESMGTRIEAVDAKYDKKFFVIMLAAIGQLAGIVVTLIILLVKK